MAFFTLKYIKIKPKIIKNDIIDNRPNPKNLKYEIDF